MKRVAVRNMGCRLNIHEGEVLSELLKEGYQLVPWEEEADYFVLNTCSVTARADQRARGYIRSAHRRAPGAKILVTGCYAQTRPEVLAGMPEVTLVVGNADKETRVRALLDQLDSGEPVDRVAVDSIWASRTLRAPLVSASPGLSRPFVKIQDGCNEICSFCKIPLARGRNRSLPLEDIVQQVELFATAGYREVVFTGVHMGCYGEDLEPPVPLPHLLAAVLAGAPSVRVRLSSIEPNHFTDDLLEFMRGEPRVQPHLHLPLQSGDDDVLSRMRRRYRASDYRLKIDRIAAALPGACLGADVMAGFPGETDAEFESTVALLESIPLAYLHVFPYSPRERTPAARAPDQVPAPVKERRGGVLRELSAKKWREFRTTQLGREHEAIVLGENGTPERTVLTANYIETTVTGPALERSQVVRVRLDSLERDGARGTLLPEPVPTEAPVEGEVSSSW